MRRSSQEYRNFDLDLRGAIVRGLDVAQIVNFDSSSSNAETHVVLPVSANVTLDETANVAFVDASGGPVTVTLPDAADGLGFAFYVSKRDATGNAVTVTTLGGNINGAPSVSLLAQYDTAQFVSDGTEYGII